MKKLSNKYINILVLLIVLFTIALVMTSNISTTSNLITIILSLLILILVLVLIVIIVLKNNEKIKIFRLYELIDANKNSIINNISIPYVIIDSSKKIVTINKEAKNYFSNINDNFQDIINTHIDIENIKSGKNFRVNIAEQYYRVEVHKVENYTNDSETYFMLYLYNETQLNDYKMIIENEKLIQGLIYVDNYDEVLSTLDDIRRSLLFSILEKRIRKYFSDMDAVVQKIDRDKFYVLIKNKYLKRLHSDKFSILETVKKLHVGNELPLTLSIGLSEGENSYIATYEQIVSAVDMALARGGDQVVVKSKNKVFYYGGKTKSVEKNTRVKSRVKAQALKTIIDSREKVLVMGHKLADIDCVGAGLGVYTLAKLRDKEVHIIIDDIINSVRPCIDGFLFDKNYPNDMFISPNDALAYIDKDTTLIIVDVNIREYTEAPELLDLAGQVVVIDHHRKGEKSIDNAVLDYVESSASSTSEMVTELLQYFKDKTNIIDQKVLDALYAGILLDTNSFVNKVGVRTFEAAAYLKKNGVDIDKVRKMFREDSVRYKAKSKAISDAYEFTKGFLIGELDGDEIDSPTELGAQAANELLNIEGIKASIVLTKVNDTVYASFRSIDEVNVQIIAEQLGGGGHQTIAGAQFHNMNIDEVRIIVINKVNEMLDGGDL